MEKDGGIIETLLFRGYQARLFSFSALDKYLGLGSLPFSFAWTDAGLGELAHYADELNFPGADLADASLDSGGRRYYFRCGDSCESAVNPSYSLLSLVQDLRNKRFLDIEGIYPDIRLLRKNESAKAPDDSEKLAWWENLDSGTGCLQAIMDGALIVARYGSTGLPPRDFIETLGSAFDNESPPGAEKQQALLIGLMCSSRPDRGLEFLKSSGFLQKFWPEIALLDNADHAKEFHPEGNAWKHTLQTFEHRKQNSSGVYDLRLSLSLLLHDTGKPIAEDSGSHRFDHHAELGAATARRFMERLNFDSAFIEDVFYLVKNHMLPAALARLSPAKTGDIMNSPLFPSLMELYRCDESSSFKGLDGFYRNSAAYQTYLRNMRNPYRSVSGKILGRGRRR
ncbi:MAG: HD domain-containing protein [Treponema sp.]|nr:HD domain-containing protein [Treponema sp.]